VKDGTVFHNTSHHLFILLVVVFFPYVSMPTRGPHFFIAHHSKIKTDQNASFIEHHTHKVVVFPVTLLRLENQSQAIIDDSAVDMLVDYRAPKIRKSYNVKVKRNMIHEIDVLVSSGMTCGIVCAKFGIPKLYYHCWKRLITKIDNVNATKEFVAYSTKGTACIIHPGRKSMLEAIKPLLQSFMFSVHERGIQLMNRMVGREAAHLLPAFKSKSV